MSDPIDFQRARRPEQKEERREQLLETARALLAEVSDPQALSLSELARRAGMAKSNVYRYFESREAILIELLTLEWMGWSEDVRAQLLQRAPADVISLEYLSQLLADAVVRRPLLGPLCSILPTIIEHNVEPETVRRFKLGALLFLRESAVFFNQQAPHLSVQAYEEFAHYTVTLLIGLWPLSHPSPAVQAVLAAPELLPFRHDFAHDFARALWLFALGLQRAESI
jgi:AcrR family transcriptional regulator